MIHDIGKQVPVCLKSRQKNNTSKKNYLSGDQSRDFLIITFFCIGKMKYKKCLVVNMFLTLQMATTTLIKIEIISYQDILY